MEPGVNRSIRHLTYHYKEFERRGLDAQLLADGAGVVGILLGRGGVGSARSVKAQQGNLDVFRGWIDIQVLAAPD